MTEPRLTVALTFDSDAMSDSIRRGDSPVKLSHGEFGPRVGVHPECMGRGHRMAMLEAFIAEAKALDGVVFDRLDAYLAQR